MFLTPVMKGAGKVQEHKLVAGWMGEGKEFDSQ
jgi:hypothetical protein